MHLGVTLPKVADQTFHRIEFQVVDKPQSTTGIAPRYFDLITLSAGTSVVTWRCKQTATRRP